jgi:hypothetical protein
VVQVTTLWPVEGPRGTVRGRVVGPLAPPGTDCLIHVTVCGVPTLLAARRVNRWTDPTHIYVCADGSLWRSDHPPTVPVTAELVAAGVGEPVEEGGIS